MKSEYLLFIRQLNYESTYKLKLVQTIESFVLKFIHKKKMIGHISFLITEEQVIISWISVNRLYRKQKLAKKLIGSTAIFCDRFFKITTITLDDMSDNAWKKHNIYRAFDFHYINEYPFPEMEGNISTIISRYNCIKNK